MTLNGWLTINEAAARVGRDPRTIRRWIAREGLAVVIGRVSEAKLIEVAERMEKRKGGRPPKTVSTVSTSVIRLR